MSRDLNCPKCHGIGHVPADGYGREDCQICFSETPLSPTQGADARPAAISEAMAEEMGETGAPHSEAERKLYEAYCKGHCWEVGQWTGTEYYEMLDRIRFAMWRDRAALATHDAAPIPSDCDVRKILLRVVPGDGSGLEVYAENVQEVEGLLSEMGERLETYEAARATAPTRYGYVYEWDYSPGVVHRSFDFAPYNGRQPDRTIEVFCAPREKT